MLSTVFDKAMQAQTLFVESHFPEVMTNDRIFKFTQTVGRNILTNS
jgi:hypothetical protein